MAQQEMRVNVRMNRTFLVKGKVEPQSRETLATFPTGIASTVPLIKVSSLQSERKMFHAYFLSRFVSLVSERKGLHLSSGSILALT